jgi:hypothetical protein
LVVRDFTAIYWIIYNGTRVPDSTVESLVDFTLGGFVKSEQFDREALDFTFDRTKASGGTKAKEVILLAAERLMGEKGYFETSIYDITSRAGYGQGTFYLHFEAKRNSFGACLSGKQESQENNERRRFRR